MRLREIKFDIRTSLAFFAKGLCMGAADVVPGVSGGTIALVLGIYERFINALRSLSPMVALSLVRWLACLGRGEAGAKAWGEFRKHFLAVDFAFLIPLGMGIVAAFLIGAQIIPHLMIAYPAPTFAFFFGLILISAKTPFRMIENFSAWHAVVIVAAAAAAFFFVGLGTDSLRMDFDGLSRRMDRFPDERVVLYSSRLKDEATARRLIDQFAEFRGRFDEGMAPELVIVGESGGVAERVLAAADAPPWAGYRGVARSERKLLERQLPLRLFEAPISNFGIMLCGAVAISAMILPGVSGSFLLLFLGQYRSVLETLGMVTTAVPGLAARMAAVDFAGFWLLANDARMPFLLSFIIGVGIGIALFSRVMSILLRHCHGVTMAALTGLMLGSLRKPFMEIVGAGGGVGILAPVLLCFGAGAALILVLDFVGAALAPEKSQAVDPPPLSS